MITSKKKKVVVEVFHRFTGRIRKDQQAYIAKLAEKREIFESDLHREMFDYYIKNNPL